jgi:hypothetical protein
MLLSVEPIGTGWNCAVALRRGKRTPAASACDADARHGKGFGVGC